MCGVLAGVIRRWGAGTRLWSRPAASPLKLCGLVDDEPLSGLREGRNIYMSKNQVSVGLGIVTRGAVRTDTPFGVVLTQVKTVKDETLIEVARRAAKIGVRAFLLCGACFHESCARFERLKGGHGKRDDKGVGAQARKREVAKQIGKDYRTLGTDARIYETFYQPGVEEGSRLERERSSPTLPREFYVTALAAPDPVGALEVALERRAEGSYPVGEFRDYVRTLKKALAGNAGDGSEPPPTVVVRLRLSAEAGAVLESEVRASGKDAGDVVSGLLLKLNLGRLRAGKATNKRHVGREKKPGRVTPATALAPSLLDLAEGEGSTQ